MAIIIANENGDWWVHSPDIDPQLCILDTSKLTAEQRQEIANEYDCEPEEIEDVLFDFDGAGDLAWEYGRKIKEEDILK